MAKKKPIRGTVRIDIRYVDDERTVSVKRIGKHPAIEEEAKRAEALLLREPGSENDMLSQEKPYTGTSTEALTLTLDSTFIEIIENTEWSVTATASGGTAPYAISWERVAVDPVADPGAERAALDNAAFLTVAADSVTFTSGGRLGNDAYYIATVVDAEGVIAESEPCNVDVEPLGGEDGAGEEEDADPDDIAQASVSAEASQTGSGSGANGEYIAGDTFTVTYTITNAGDVDLTGVSLTNTETNVSGISIAIGGEHTETFTHTVTAAEEANGLISFGGTVNSDQTDPEPISSLGVLTGERVFGSIPWGFWVEYRNQLNRSPEFRSQGSANFGLTHTKAVGSAQPGDQGYVKSVIDAARQSGSKLHLQFLQVSEWGTAYPTAWVRNLGLPSRVATISNYWSQLESRFGPSAPNGVNAYIRDAIDDGTIEMVLLYDEPHHIKWSPTYQPARTVDGQSVKAKGSATHISNQEIDDTADLLKTLFNRPNLRTTVRAGANMIVAYGRGNHVFQHMTNADVTINSNKHKNRGFERFMTDVTAPAYASTGLSPDCPMLQFGFNSVTNPYTGATTWRDDWWDDGNNGNTFSWADGSSRYVSGYIKTSPLEADWWRCALFAKRDPVTWALDPNGVVLPKRMTIFRGDRNSESTWENQWYQDVINHWKTAIPAGDITPLKADAPVIEA